MDLTVAGCEDLEGIESSVGFPTVMWASKKPECPPPPAAELLLLEIHGFSDF
jgi:hypothetical protein